MMPEINYFRVTQSREILVAAHSPVDAVRIANRAFDNNALLIEGIWGHPTSEVTITDISAHKEK
jgi:hypothetical protein